MADSALPEFWNTRYQDHATPWDAGRVPGALQRHLRDLPAGSSVLIPGCGSAYEAYYLAENGFEVLAVDFSPQAVARAKTLLGCFADRVQQADFFRFDPGPVPFDVVYERAFLCALPPKMWDAYAERVAQLLRPGGLLAGFFFFDDNPRGPPFGITVERVEQLLTPHFERIADEPVSDSIAVFQGKERWQIWRRGVSITRG